MKIKKMFGKNAILKGLNYAEGATQRDQQLVIAWTDEMQVVLDKYPENESDYLLPIIRNPGSVELYAYRNAGYNINRSLKKVAEKAGIDVHLTLYVARHSWAQVAKGIPLSVISEGLGHDSEATSRIYPASLDTSVIDNANSLIMQSLKQRRQL